MSAPRARRTGPLVRDQPETPFAAILRALLGRVAGARAAVLVDFEGETVDYAGQGEPYELRVAAAHWRIVLEETRLSRARTTWLAAATDSSCFRIQALPSGYAVLLVVASGLGMPATCERAMASCAAELANEAGWQRSGDPQASWFGLDVVTDARRRPAALRVGPRTEPLEIIGRLAEGLRRCERGWRVRTARGVEANLIREPGPCWYVDEISVREDSTEPSPKSV